MQFRPVIGIKCDFHTCSEVEQCGYEEGEVAYLIHHESCGGIEIVHVHKSAYEVRETCRKEEIQGYDL